MGNADALSHLPVEAAPNSHDKSILLMESFNLPITAKTIAETTKKDPVLSKVLQGLIIGRNLVSSQEDCKPYTAVWSELSAEQGCILKGARVVIPKDLQNKVMKDIHTDHEGIVRSKAIARNYVWWPKIDRDIEMFVKQCQGCATHQSNPIPARMHPWGYPQHAWQRLHLDYAGPFRNHSYLIVVDAYSKWPEIISVQSPTSGATIQALMPIFATHGLPESIVSLQITVHSFALLNLHSSWQPMTYSIQDLHHIALLQMVKQRDLCRPSNII